MENMMDKYENMNEKEKQEFMKGLSVEEKQKFMNKKKERDQQKIQSMMEGQNVIQEEQDVMDGV